MRRPLRGPTPALSLLLPLALAVPAAAQQGMANVRIETIPVADGVYMLTGQGGNIGVSVGDDGVFVIDDQYAPLTDRILAAIRAITPAPVRFVVNTHWHGDHVGGNENMGEAGALLVAHHNVRSRLEVEQVLERVGRVDTTAAAPEGALPVLTFGEDVTFHLNGDELHAFHVEHAHTDGDAIIHFRRSDVVHMGDTYFSAAAGTYPFIDIGSGGTIDGLIAAIGAALAVMGPDTRVIPGHGALATRDEVRAYADMLKAVRDRVAAAKRQGRTEAQVQAERPTREWDAEREGGFVSADAFVAAVYRSLPARP